MSFSMAERLARLVRELAALWLAGEGRGRLMLALAVFVLMRNEKFESTLPPEKGMIDHYLDKRGWVSEEGVCDDKGKLAVNREYTPY